MDINKISNEIATLKRAVKTAATASLKDKLKKKIVSLNEVLKDANIPAKRLAMILLGAKRKVFSYTTAEFNAIIKRLSYKAEYSFLKGLTKPEIKDDLERYAKNPGWRFKGRGNYKTPTKKDLAADAGLPYGKRTTYYEKRSNRSDVTNPAKLKDGGNIKMNEIGFNIQEVTKSLSSNEKNQLIKLSNNVVEKAKKKGFSLYVNLREFKKGAEIEIVIKHNHNMIEGKPEYHFMNSFEYKIERSVRITDDLTFEVTTGSYDNSWDENTISIDKYFNIIDKAKLKRGGGVEIKEGEDYLYGRVVGKNYTYTSNKIPNFSLKIGIFKEGKSPNNNYAYLSVPNNIDVSILSDLLNKSGSINNSNNSYSNQFSRYDLSEDEVKTIINHFKKISGTKKMGKGGGVGEENKEMVLNNAQQIEHHAEELENAAKNSKHVPAWVVAKIYNASSNISDATHYLEGVNTMPKEQFERIHEEVENHKMETGGGLDSFLGKQMHVSKVCKTHGCSTKDYLHAKKKYKTGGIIDINELNLPVIRTQFEDEEYEFKEGGGVDKKKKTDFTIYEYIQLEKQKLREHNAKAHEDDRLDWADWKSELTKEDTKEYGIYYNSRMLDSNGDRGFFEYLPTNKNYSEDDYAKGGKMKQGGAVKGAKFKHYGKELEIKKVQDGAVYTTDGKQYSLKVLESLGVTFNKERAKSNKPRGVRGNRREQMEGDVAELEYDLKGYKQDLRQLNFDMELEAGEKGNNWSDADANRYGREMNELEEKIKSLKKQIAEKEQKLSYKKGGEVRSKLTGWKHRKK